jgi:hypothetical protein
VSLWSYYNGHTVTKPCLRWPRCNTLRSTNRVPQAASGSKADVCRALPLLVAQLDDVSGNPEAATCAASTIWALLHRGERVKATLKGLSGAVASVQRCAQVSSSLAEGEARIAEPSEEAAARLRWLQQAAHAARTLSRVLDKGAGR